MSSSQGFEQLHPGIQKWIHDQKWSELRPIQEMAVAPILARDKDVIISAATASGKTEAAFFPACTYIKKETKPGVRILYISPLKALINDQYRRLYDLCEIIDLPLTPWHGDVSIATKFKQQKNPSGILLITPESLEGRLMRYRGWCEKAFQGLDYFVIDEFHYFLGSERGCQLLSLMGRIEFMVNKPIPRIALSATFNDMKQVAEYLRPQKNIPYEVVESPGQATRIKLLVKGYIEPPRDSNISESADIPMMALEKISEDLFRVLRKKSHLVFANSRANVEKLSDMLTQRCKRGGLPNEFFPHHGNLSKDIREELEKRLQKGDLPTTALATSTLELGIDIGSVDSVVQIGVAPAVSSIRQRLGRSGRRGGDAVYRPLIIERRIKDATDIIDKLRIDTVQSIAMISLMLDKWCEPPPKSRYNFSTLVQQTLSLIAQYGSVRANQLWQLLCKRGPFNLVDEKLYDKFLRALATKELIHQDHEGRILIGIRGERLVGLFHFCTSFQTEEEYRIIFEGKSLGTIPKQNPLSVGEAIIFAGRRWIVLEMIEDRKIIMVDKSGSGKVPDFSGGGFMMHGKIREEMFNIYSQSKSFSYLDEITSSFLEEGVSYFHQLGLINKRILNHNRKVYIIPWSDDKVIHTISALLIANGSFRGISCHRGIVEISNSDIEEVKLILSSIFGGPKPTLEKLCEKVLGRYTEKYDWALSDELVTLGYGQKMFDIDATWAKMQEILD